MEKSLMGLVAAIGAVAPLAGAGAAVVSSEDAARALHASSISELLEPVANATAVLAALDAAPASAPQDKPVKVAQWYHHHHHHWHHHHHRYYHHHHHHHYYYHHHHHHNHYRRRGCFETPVGYVCP